MAEAGAPSGGEPTGRRTTVLVPVPEAEGLVGPYRSRFDPSGSDGVPAHITLLYPFVPAEDLTPETLDALSTRLAAAEPFAFVLARAERFMEVVYLAPEPSEPFRALARALSADAPGQPPYAGSIVVTDILPHVTVAHSADAEELDRVERDLATGLTIASTAREVWLMVEAEDGWRLHTCFPLGRRSST